MAFLGAATALSTAGLQVYEGQQQRKVAKTAQRETERANLQAESAAMRQQRETANELAKARRQRPDASSLLSGEKAGSSTLLTGPLGVDSSTLRLGKPSLLGL